MHAKTSLKTKTSKGSQVWAECPSARPRRRTARGFCLLAIFLLLCCSTTPSVFQYLAPSTTKTVTIDLLIWGITDRGVYQSLWHQPPFVLLTGIKVNKRSRSWFKTAKRRSALDALTDSPLQYGCNFRLSPRSQSDRVLASADCSLACLSFSISPTLFPVRAFSEGFQFGKVSDVAADESPHLHRGPQLSCWRRSGRFATALPCGLSECRCITPSY
ncbi:unnamed protein product [Caenorhabditis auriculariae]|uniref:Uncharacterized protein n=1 Tax=Caenorhabditis auriculariae TaxID=2777116 RepID=A0A8S1GUS3_9PELO|nr:unnamed protein product [Caenorhabditis auriculariae]